MKLHLLEYVKLFILGCLLIFIYHKYFPPSIILEFESIPKNEGNAPTSEEGDINEDLIKLKSLIQTHYSVPEELVEQIATHSINYENKEVGFPSRFDIISVIAIESGFNCRAVSKNDHGCMQLNKRAWGKEFPNTAFTDIEDNIKFGSYLLTKFYVNNGSNKQNAIIAYNVGQDAFNKNRYNYKHYNKFVKVYNKFIQA